MAETVVRNCKFCRHAVFDRIWGEYKCKLYQRTVYDADEITDCDDWLRRQKSLKDKRNADN